MIVTVDDRKFIVYFHHEQEDPDYLDAMKHKHRKMSTPEKKLTGSHIEIYQTPRGQTTCRVLDFTTQEHLASGIALCCPKDNFKKAVGRKVSLQRACAMLADMIGKDPHTLTENIFSQYFEFQKRGQTKTQENK